jgi:hypothetical protein
MGGSRTDEEGDVRRVDLVRLRELLSGPIVGLKDRFTGDQLPDVCTRLGLPPSTDGSKRERMQASFDAVPDEGLVNVALNYLTSFSPPASMRNTIQELLWTSTPGPSIPKKYRREVARALADNGDLFLDARRFDELLHRLWVVENDPLALFGGPDNSLRAQIERHVHRNRVWLSS